MLESQAEAARSAAEWERQSQRALVPMTISAADAVAPGLAAAHICAQIGDVLARGLRLSVALAGLRQGKTAADAFRRICAMLSECADAHDVPPARIEIVVAAGIMRPLAAWQLRQEALGPGTLYLLASEQELRGCPGSRVHFRQFWRELWSLQPAGYVRLACAPLILSRCPLLSGEVGGTVLPSAALQVPAGSAWLLQRIDLCDFACADGLIDKTALQHALHRCVDRGLQSHERAEWPNAVMQHDSWLNRRLAVTITGIGDLVVRRQHDPRRLDCLLHLRESMHWIQSTLHSYSQRVTAHRGIVPALDQANPLHTLSGDDRWARRWYAALEKHAIACRNLLALSPWSVFPTAIDPDPDFANLLPLLTFADACAFPRPPRLSGWNINDFIRLHQQIWAVRERREASQLFAEQV